MANEAILVQLLGNGGDPVDVTVADGTGIEKYALLTLTDPRTGATVSATPAAAGYVCAGIAAAEKVASDGQVNLAVYTNGIFDLVASGAITVGAPVKSCGNNQVCAAVAADVASGAIMGYALETASDAERIEVRLRK